MNTRSGRNQCAPATSGLDLPSRKDCTPRFGQIYNGALTYHNMRSLYLQCTCKYQEPRTPHPQAMITRKKKEIKLINDVWVTADFG